MNRIFVSALIAFVMSGCAANGPAFDARPSSISGAAHVYIYRVDSPAWGGRDAYFYVNDLNVADLSRNGHTQIDVAKGTYVLKQKWPLDITLGMKTLEVPVRWENGANYYYRFVAIADAHSVKWQLTKVDESIALSELKETRYQPPKDAGKSLVHQR